MSQDQIFHSLCDTKNEISRVEVGRVVCEVCTKACVFWSLWLWETKRCLGSGEYVSLSFSKKTNRPFKIMAQLRTMFLSTALHVRLYIKPSNSFCWAAVN